MFRGVSEDSGRIFNCIDKTAVKWPSKCFKDLRIFICQKITDAYLTDLNVITHEKHKLGLSEVSGEDDAGLINDVM